MRQLTTYLRQHAGHTDRKTWSRRNTGEVWSSRVKTCPTDKFINQIDDVFRIAQIWIRLYQNG